MTALKLTQITDLHLGPTPDFTCRNIATYQTLKAVLTAIERDGRGEDRLLLTGDIASDGKAQAYRQLDQLLLAQNKQALWLPGNHDRMDLMHKNFVHFPFMPVFEDKNWAIIMLDSSLPDQPEGFISKDQMHQLENYMDNLAHKNILVTMHHSPVAVNSLWVDKHRIANHSLLHKLLVAHGKVRAVINGHIHQEHQADWDGITVYATPSTCFQFKPKVTDFILDDRPPAYRWIDLYDDGKINTGVKYLQSFSADTYA